jgi:hypothetical protein
MAAGARTPEELEMLLEDAFVLRDHEALAQLFHPDAVLALGGGSPEARGLEEIMLVVRSLWDQERIYLADPRRIIEEGDTALVLSGHATNVVARGHGRTWRYVICCLAPVEPKGMVVDHGASRDTAHLSGPS